MKKTGRSKSPRATKKKWTGPKLEILSEKTFEGPIESNKTVIHAQYTGGGGTVTHGTGLGGLDPISVYTACQ